MKQTFQPTSREEFCANFDNAKSQMFWRWIPADLHTPLSVYLKLCSAEANSFLLESVEGGTKLGRYSAIGFDPDYLWSYKDGVIDARDLTNSARAISPAETNAAQPLVSFSNAIKSAKVDVVHDSLPMASSGLFGVMGYDMVRHVEDIADDNPDTLSIPDARFMRPQCIIIFDHLYQMMCVAMPVRDHSGQSELSAADTFASLKARMNEILHKIETSVPQLPQEHSKLDTPLDIKASADEAAYKEIVNKAKNYIIEGDVFQVVPSIRFCVPFDLSSISFYRSLRRLNPAPFLFHLAFEDFALIGSSPEILVRVRDSKVTIRPIAGTRKRGADDTEDQQNEDDLLSDPKERAEHLMLLDLARNDVGKIAEIGSIKITEPFTVERYSHVMHIISNVEGTLARDKTPMDALFSGFPAGTVSGAPKIRAMNIIDELETVRRGFYGGCVGYFDGNGNIDTCITLRTACLKDGILTLQSGAGIVADSDPQMEYQECLNKAAALIDAASHAIDLSKTPE
jgi:anthranilate synthase component 1